MSASTVTDVIETPLPKQLRSSYRLVAPVVIEATTFIGVNSMTIAPRVTGPVRLPT
jgi:hypothetical protein